MRLLALALALPIVLGFAFVPSAQSARATSAPTLAPLGAAADWLNGKPDLNGKVVIVDVFTFGCSNCQAVTPNLQRLRKAISTTQLAIVGVHTPETPYERERPNVIRALREQQITWPVVLDPDNKLWNAFGVDAWPTQFVFDRHGTLRKVVVGDSQDSALNGAVQTLLAERPSEKVVLAGGCFWGMEAVFDSLKGVVRAVPGYSGGSKATAHYEIVSTGMTGHAESVEITYDPTQISFAQLLRVYFTVAHDPTELNRQGPDEGTQYRSEIFYTSDAQRDAAKQFIRELEQRKAFSRPIVTKVEKLSAFYPAEEYHLHYVARHPNEMYVVYNDLPKLDRLRREFPSLLTAKR